MANPNYSYDDQSGGDFKEKLVSVNRVSKTVKGGKQFAFAALTVVGDGAGRVGFGYGKAREVPEAIRKATDAAKRAMVRIPLKDSRTLHHETVGRHGAGRVILRPAGQGTGIIAGGPMRDYVFAKNLLFRHKSIDTDVWLQTRAHDLLPHYEKNIPLGRIGAPRDCAGAVVFLCSEAAAYVHGTVLRVDGGWLGR